MQDIDSVELDVLTTSEGQSQQLETGHVNDDGGIEEEQKDPLLQLEHENQIQELLELEVQSRQEVQQTEKEMRTDLVENENDERTKKREAIRKARIEADKRKAEHRHARLALEQSESELRTELKATEQSQREKIIPQKMKSPPPIAGNVESKQQKKEAKGSETLLPQGNPQKKKRRQEKELDKKSPKKGHKSAMSPAQRPSSLSFLEWKSKKELQVKQEKEQYFHKQREIFRQSQEIRELREEEMSRRHIASLIRITRRQETSQERSRLVEMKREEAIRNRCKTGAVFPWENMGGKNRRNPRRKVEHPSKSLLLTTATADSSGNLSLSWDNEESPSQVVDDLDVSPVGNSCWSYQRVPLNLKSSVD